MVGQKIYINLVHKFKYRVTKLHSRSYYYQVQCYDDKKMNALE